MKTLLVILTAALNLTNVHGQNLVQNPGFENYTACPTEFAQIANAVGWYSFRESCDYYNLCGTFLFKTPSNIMGYQAPHSGNAYAGIITYDSTAGSYKEIIGNKLVSPLIIGQQYNISFYVSLAILPSTNCAFASNKMGAKFTTKAYTAYTNQIPINNIAPLYYDTIITDTTNWKLIAGSFIADSAYTYLAIGNFFDDANTDTLRLGSGTLPVYAYYYIDDISMTADPLGAATNYFNNQVDLFPNPFIDKLTINTGNNKPADVILYDILSRKLLQQKFTNSVSLNTEQLEKGIYIYEVRNKEGVLKKGRVVKE